MALVGTAYISVRAITRDVQNDIRRGFSGVNAVGSRAGADLGRSFSRGFNANAGANMFTRISAGLRTLAPGAEQAREAFTSLVRTGYTVGTTLSVLVAGASSLVGGLVSIAGAAAGAIGAVAALGNVFVALGLGMGVARLALGGVGKALSALNKQTGGGGGGGGASDAADQAREAAARRVRDAEEQLNRTIERNRESMVDANNDVRDAQLALNKALEDGREEIQQLGFDAEDAALSEKRAVIDLERARETLARVQDLPPNSRARREAELAYQEAELNLRKARDRSADLNKEQDRLAKTGVAGTSAAIDAANALAKAEENRAKTARDGMRSEADAAQSLADAKAQAAKAGAAGAAGGGGGGADPFAGLNQAQIDFVKFLQEIGPRFRAIKDAASEAFLPPLTTAIRTIADGAIPTLVYGATVIGAALGGAAINFANAVVAADNIGRLTAVFDISSRVIGDLGKILASTYGAVLSLLTASSTQTLRFTGYIRDLVARFDEWSGSLEGQTTLSLFFARAGDAAAQFGRIFGDIFAGLGNIINANLGPGTGGGYLLNWLETATTKFREIPQNELRAYFNDVAVNAQSVMSAIGALLSELIKLGRNDSIKQTFDILGQGAPLIGELIRLSAEAGPSLARLVNKLLEIFVALADTGAIEVFFDTLTSLATIVEDVLSNGIIKTVTDSTGRVFAFISALGLVGTLGITGLTIVAGSLARVSGAIGTVQDGFGKFKGLLDTFTGGSKVSAGLGDIADNFKSTGNSKDDFIRNLQWLQTTYATTAQKAIPVTSSVKALGSTMTTTGTQTAVASTTMGTTFSAAMAKVSASIALVGRSLATVLLGPVGIVIGVVAALVGLFILLYNTNEQFARDMDAVWAELTAAFSQAGEDIMAAIMPLVPLLTGAFSQIIQAFVPLITTLAQAFSEILVQIAPLIATIIGALVPAITAIITAIVPLITTIVTALVPVFTTLITAIVPLITTIITALVPVITTLISAIVPLITTIIGALVPVFTALIQAIVPVVELLLGILVPIIQVVAGVLAFLIPIITQVAVVIINILVAAITFLVEGFVNFIKFLPQIGQTFSDVWNNIVSFFTTVWEAIVLIVRTYFDIVFTVINTVVTAISDFWNGMWQGISDFFGGIWNGIVVFVTAYIAAVQTVIRDVTNTISGIWNAIWTGISNFFSDIWNGIVNYVTTYINTVRTIIDNVTRTIRDIWNNIWNGISSFFSGIWDGIVNTVRNFRQIFEDIFGGIRGFVENAFNGVLGAVRGPINGIISLVNQAIRSLNGLRVEIPAWVPGVGGQTFGLSIPTIPQLAKGGIIPATRGGMLVNVAEAGNAERVQPLQPNGRTEGEDMILAALQAADRSINITVNPSAGMDEAALATEVGRQLAFQLRKGASAW